MKLPPEAQQHLSNDHVAWLTTVNAKHAPSPTPVWFVVDDDAVIVFTNPSSRKVANIETNPVVTLHFNSDREGSDVVVLGAHALLERGAPPSALPAYVEKYRDSIAGMGMTPDEFD